MASTIYLVLVAALLAVATGTRVKASRREKNSRFLIVTDLCSKYENAISAELLGIGDTLQRIKDESPQRRLPVVDVNGPSRLTFPVNMSVFLTSAVHGFTDAACSVEKLVQTLDKVGNTFFSSRNKKNAVLVIASGLTQGNYTFVGKSLKKSSYKLHFVVIHDPSSDAQWRRMLRVAGSVFLFLPWHSGAECRFRLEARIRSESFWAGVSSTVSRTSPAVVYAGKRANFHKETFATSSPFRMRVIFCEPSQRVEIRISTMGGREKIVNLDTGDRMEAEFTSDTGGNVTCKALGKQPFVLLVTATPALQ